MATTYRDNGGSVNGSNKVFTFPFETIETTASDANSEVKVALNGVTQATNKYTVGSGIITFGSTDYDATVQASDGAPLSGVTVRVFRDTKVNPALTGGDRRHTFQAGSAVKAKDLNDIYEHSLFALHEEQEQPITKSRLDANCVTATEIADNSVDSEHYVDGSIDLAHMSANSVDSDQYVDGSIDGIHIANDVIDSQHYAADSIDAEHYAPGSVDGTAIANDAVDSQHYAADSIDAEHYAPGSVDGTAIANDAIDSQHYAAGSIDNEHIADGAIDSAALDAATIVTNSEQSGYSANDTSFYTTAASDARYYNIGSTEEIVSSETWVSDDASIATTKAVDNRVINLVDEVGGFVPITNETDFPATNPDINSAAGTIVSIGVLTTSYTSSGSGVITIPASTLDNLSNDLTITGAANSTTYGANFGMLVETKALSDAAYAAAPSYTFHRLVPKSSEVTTLAGIASNITTVAGISSNVTTVAGVASNVTTVAGVASNVTTVAGSIANVNTTASNIANVNNFASTYQISGSAPSTDGGGASLAEGDLYFDTSGNELKVYNGSSWQGGVTATGNLISKAGDEFTGAVGIPDGTTSAPGLYNVGDTNTGLYFGAADEVDITVGGSTKLEVNSTGIDVTGNIVVSGTVDGIDVSTLTATPEGAVIKSTTNGNEADTKYLRADGDGTCSWQNIPAGSDTTYSHAANDAGSGNVNLRLSAGGSGSGDDDILITAGSNVTISSITGFGFTISATDTNTTYSVVDSSAAGLAPTLPGSHGGKFLKADGTWEVPSYTTNTNTQLSNAEVRTAVEAASDSNVFTDADHTKLNAIEASADVTDATNVNAAGAIMEADVDAKGDILAGTADNTVARLAVGSNTQVLTADSSTSTGLAWAAASSGTITALNNQAANRLTTIGSTTTQLDGEASLTFEDTTSTGLISGKQITGRGFECPATVADDWTIAAANNAMFPGPMTIAADKTVTVPAGRTLTIV